MGETLKFPTSPQAVEALLKNIGVDGIRYEEFFITSFDGDVLGLYDYLGEYENLDELNHLACLLSELPQSEIEKFEAALHMGTHASCVADIINLAENLDSLEPSGWQLYMVLFAYLCGVAKAFGFHLPIHTWRPKWESKIFRAPSGCIPLLAESAGILSGAPVRPPPAPSMQS